MQRISVDLPDPDGPQITIRSPRFTVMLISRSTWKVPYHLFIAVIWIATSSRTCIFFCASAILASLTVICLQLALQIHRVSGHAEAEEEEDRADENERLPVDALPRDVGAHDFGDALQRIGQAHQRDKRGVLEQTDEGRHDAGDRDFQRLRHDDQPL